MLSYGIPPLSADPNAFSQNFQIPLWNPTGSTTPAGLGANTVVNPSTVPAPVVSDPLAAAANAAVTPAVQTGIVPPLNTSFFPNAPTTTPTTDTSTSSTGLGFNTGTLGLALGGLQTIGSLWSAFQANKLAKQQFKFTKDFTNTNLRNSIQSYNTTLGNHTAARAAYEGWSGKEERQYVKDNKLTRH